MKPEPIVKQGPEWLANLLYGGPAWLQPVLLVAVVLLLAAVVIGLMRVGPDPRLLSEMVSNVVVVATCGVGTFLLVTYGTFPYWVDVSGGVVLGAVVAVTVQPERVEGVIRPIVEGESEVAES
jgi:hypothetical protein